MKKRFSTRVISAVLSLLVMVTTIFAGVDYSVYAADGAGQITTSTTSTWQQVSLTEISATDQIAIVMSTSNGATYLLSNAETSSCPKAVTAKEVDAKTTVEGTTIDMTFEGVSSDYTWNISASDAQTADDVEYTITSTKSTTDKTLYLYTTAANNGMRVGTTEAKWKNLQASAGYLSTTDSKSAVRYLGVYEANSDWRAYTNTTGNTKGQTVKFYKLVANTDSSTVTVADGKYVIYNPSSEMAFSSTRISDKYNAGEKVELNGAGSFNANTLSSTVVWTITNVDGGIKISNGDNTYSMAADSYNTGYNDTNDIWTVSLAQTSGCYYIKNNGKGNYLEWYSKYSEFSTYSKVNNESLFAMQLIPVSDAMIKTESTDPESTETSETTETQATESTETTLPTLADGKYFIYSASAGGVMKYSLTGGVASYVAGTVGDDGSISFSDGKAQGAAAYNFTKRDDGTYLISVGSGSSVKYLTANTSEELYWAEGKAVSGSYWNITYNTELKGYTISSANLKYNDKYDIYMEFYSSKGFCLYTAKTLSDIYAFQFYSSAAYDEDGDGYCGTQPKAATLPTVGSTYIIYNESGKSAIGSWNAGSAEEGTESSMYTVNYTTDESGKLVANNGALIFTVGSVSTLSITGDQSKVAYVDFEPIEGTSNYYITYGGKYLTTTATGSNITLEATANDYSIWTLEDNGDGTFKIKSVNAKYNKKDQYIEYFSSSKYLCFKATSYNSQYASCYNFSAWDKDTKQVTDFSNAKSVALYNGAGVMFTTEVSTGASASGNFTGVAAAGGCYYTFMNNGKYLASDTDEELLLTDSLDTVKTTSEDGTTTIDSCAEWELVETEGGFLFKNAEAAWVSSSGNRYPVYIEYFSGAFAGYSFKATSAEIFTLNFEACEDTYGTGYVVNPSVNFNKNNEANLGVDYTVNFTLDDLGTVNTTSATVKFEDGSSKTYAPTMDNYDGTFTIPAEDLAGHSSMTVTVNADTIESGEGIAAVHANYSGDMDVTINDEPVITNVKPNAGGQTGSNKKPVIEVSYANIGENATVELTLNDEAVALSQTATKASYTSSTDMEDGKYVAVATITRADGKTTSKTWSFYVGTQGVQLYFGQIHSHTAEYSDGSGTLEQAYEYSMNTAADCDYMIVTDHSNYFDTTATATKESMFDAAASSILASKTVDENGNTLNLWQEAKATAASYNAQSKDFVAAYGYEMTWSGGPGHINVFNTEGIVSRNNTELNTKTNDSGMFAFYDLLVEAQEKNATYTGTQGSTIAAQFNHPGTTFGYFDSFAGWTEERDELMNLIEVGNGDGVIGGTAYFPSYEYYDMCLAAGWHVAPTNGQDNHKGAWGDSNTARTVVLTDNFTEDGIYEAMSQRHIYSTEDQNLSILYYLDDTLQGGIIDDYNKDKVNLTVTLSDSDQENLGYVYVIGENGKVLYTSDQITDNSAALDITLDNTSAYYYVKVVEKDGDIAVTAPVWVDSVNAGSVKAKASTTYAGESDGTKPVVNNVTTLTSTLKNNESDALTLESYTITDNGTAVASETVDSSLAAGETYSVNYNWKPSTNGTHKIVTTYVVKVGDTVQQVTSTKSIYVAGEDYDTVVSIKTAKAGKDYQEFTVEGVVTANASGYDKDTAFFDCIYIQDVTGGINVFPVSGNYHVGQKVRVHGAITYYNGEIELNVSDDYGGYVKVISDETAEVKATQVTTKTAMSDENIGLLMSVTGKVTRVHEASGIVDRIYVNDGTGDACVYINGYIWNSVSKDNSFGPNGDSIAVGDTVTVTGIGSVDVDELGEVEYLHRLRIRDRAEIVKTTAGSDSESGVTTADGTYYKVNNETISSTEVEKTDDGVRFTTETVNNISAEISNNGNNQMYKFDLVDSGVTTVDSSILKAAQGKKVLVSFNFKDSHNTEYSWTINGEDITSVTGDINLEVTSQTDAVPSTLVKAATGKNQSFQISLTHDGAFGFTGQLTWTFDQSLVGKYANLYYYNPTKGTLELMGSSEISLSATASFDFVHASDYLMVISDEAMAQTVFTDPAQTATADTQNSVQGVKTANTSASKSANTGDSTSLYSFVLLLIAGVGVLLISRKKKQSAQ